MILAILASSDSEENWTWNQLDCRNDVFGLILKRVHAAKKLLVSSFLTCCDFLMLSVTSWELYLRETPDAISWRNDFGVKMLVDPRTTVWLGCKWALSWWMCLKMEREIRRIPPYYFITFIATVFVQKIWYSSRRLLSLTVLLWKVVKYHVIDSHWEVVHSGTWAL